MKTSTKIALGIIGVVSVGALGYVFMKRGQSTTVNNLTNGTSGDSGYPKLDWIESKEVSDWLQGRFDTKTLNDLKGWLQLIKRERTADSSKWTKSSDYHSLQISDIAGALYQIQTHKGGGVWSVEIKNEIMALK